MRCGVLGPLEVREDGGGLLVVPGAKERRLLALLVAAHPAAVTVDRLIDQLWEGRAPPTARKSLHAHVVRLRTALEPTRVPGSPGRYVVRREDGYVLTLARHEIDAAEFGDLCSKGRALLSSGDVTAARSTLQRASELWRGDPYADWPDAEFSGVERRRLEETHGGVELALLECDLALGRHREVLPDLERLVLEQPLHEELWSMLAVALYRSGRQGDALATIRRARDVLMTELGVEPGPLLRSTEHDVLAQAKGLDLPGAVDVGRLGTLVSNGLDGPGTGTSDQLGDICPYKGLTTYEPEDVALFHGRAELVQRLVARLVDSTLVVVSGSSGAGKSSLVRAGLLPALGRGAIPGADRWPHLVVTSGPRAVDALADLSGPDEPQKPAVLVCDQLEEQWAGQTDPKERGAFLDSVRGLLAEGRVARCVLVLRADHIGRLFEHRSMAGLTTSVLELVPSLTEAQLREVIEAPATAVGLTVEPELVDTVVRDVLGRAGGLPLMSMAMVGTWARRRDHTLTLAGYLEAGGVAGAVARTAEEAIATFDEAGIESARRVLVRLADHDDQGVISRRRASLAELGLVGPDAEMRREVVDALVARRLLTMDSATLEVAHEALLTAWPRLAEWLADDAVGRAVRRHLAPAAREWDAHGRPDDELYRGGRLNAATEWAARPDADPTAEEQDFLAAGTALAEAEVTAAHARADAEAAARGRIRRLAVGLSAALVLAILATVIAVGYQRTADDRATDARTARTISEANRLAALSRTARSLDLTLLLAAQAMRTARTAGTEEGLFDALLTHRRATGISAIGGGVDEVVIGPDERTLFAARVTGEPTVVSWPVGSQDQPTVLDEDWPLALAVAPSGDALATVTPDWEGGGGHVISLFSAAGETVGTIEGEEAIGGFPSDIVFMPDGRLLAVVLRGGDPRSEWRAYLTDLDVERGRHGPMRLIAGSGSPRRELAARFATDGSGVLVHADADHRIAWYLDLGTDEVTRLVPDERGVSSYELLVVPGAVLQTWTDGAVTRYDASGRPAQLLTAHSDGVIDAAVTPDGRTGVTVGDTVQVWDISARTGEWLRREVLVGHEGDVVQADVSGDGRTLYTVGVEGQVITWDLTGTEGFGAAYGSIGDRWVSNRMQVVESGRVVVMPARGVRRGRTADLGPGSLAAVFMDPRTGREIDRVVVGTTDPNALFGSAVAVSPDRKLVAATYLWGTAVVDTATREIVARITLPARDAQPDYPSEQVWSASWSADGSELLLAAVGEEGEHERLVVVDANTWRPSGKVNLPSEAQVLEWSPDRSQLAAGLGTERAVTFLDDDLRRIRTSEVGDHPFDLAYSPDGSMLAAAGAEGEVTVLDTATGRQVNAPAKLTSDFISDVEWLPDNNTVVASGADSVAVLYDVDADIVRAGSMPAADSLEAGYAFLLPEPDDEVVVLDGQHPGLRYPLDVGLWLARACEVAGRDLTRAEWARYVPEEPYRPTCSDLGEVG